MGDRPEFDRDAAAAKYLPRVLALARRLCAGRTDWRDEAEGEAVIGLTKAIANFRGGDFQTFAMTIVRRRVKRLLRKLRHQESTRPAVTPILDTDVSSRPPAARQRLAADTLRVLTPTLRRAVELVHCEGMTHAEAAGVLGVSKAQVGKLLEDAAMRIRFGLPEAERGPTLFDSLETNPHRAVGTHRGNTP